MLRGLLRAIDRNVTSVAGNTQWRQEALARFRVGPAIGGAHAGHAGPGGDAAARRADGTGAGPRMAVAGPGATTGRGTWTDSELKIAKDITTLVNTIAQHQDLLKTYNIGLDGDERTKRMVEATARRMGFALPQAPGAALEQQQVPPQQQQQQ